MLNKLVEIFWGIVYLLGLQGDEELEFDAFVNYDQPLSKAIKACGFARGQEDGYISEGNFPLEEGETGSKKIHFRLFLGDRNTNRKEDITAVMDIAGYRPASLRELLAAGAVHRWGFKRIGGRVYALKSQWKSILLMTPFVGVMYFRWTGMRPRSSRHPYSLRLDGKQSWACGNWFLGVEVVK